MRKLGFCSISALDRPLEAAAEVAAGAGLDGLEVTARPPHLDPEAGTAAAREAGRAVRAAGIDVIAYGSYLGRPDVAQRAQAEREVSIAEALQTPLLRVWAEPVSDREGEPDKGFRRVVELLRRTCDFAEPIGVTVAVERHIGSFADTPERIERLLAAVERPNLVLNYQVLDYLPPKEADAQPAEAARLVRHARYFHLKNYRPGTSEEALLEPGGSLEGGVLDYRRILPAALDAGYDGPLTFEFVSWEPKPLEEKLAADAAFVRGILAGRKPQ
jgi:sugar phosphate isomerase/epimerase